MNLFLQLICYGLLANGVLSILDAKNRVKRHIWRGSPNSQTIDEPRYIQTKGGRNHHHPAALHHQTLTPKCGPYESGIKAHPFSCQMYINCLDGEVTVETCSEGFLFDPVTKECDFASNLVCSLTSGQSARLQSSYQGSHQDSYQGSYQGSYQDSYKDSYQDSRQGSHQGSYQDSHRDTSHYTKADKEVVSHFKCPHEGLFEHPHDCTKFIQCAHSGLFVQSCGPGTKFNPSLLVCDWPKNVRCNKNVNGNIITETPSHKSEFSHNQMGHETRPVDAAYDYNFDVRMSDTDSRSNNNNNDQQRRVYSTSAIQNEHTQGSYHRSNNSFQSHQTNSRPGQRSYPQYPQNSLQTESQTNVQHPPETSPQYTRSHRPQLELTSDDLSLTQQQQEVFPDTSQSRAFQTLPQSGLQAPSRTNVQYQQTPQYVPSRVLQLPRQTSPQEISDSTFTQQQEAHHSASSQSRTHQPETNRQENFGILTSVQPLAHPRTQQNGDSVHSSPSYSKTKIYSSQQSNPYPSSGYPSISSSHASTNQRSEDIDRPQPVNRQSPSNRQLQNFDQTMDLLDTYANFETTKRFEGQSDRQNVMTVDRGNSNRDHEIPIYNRPINMRFKPMSSGDRESDEAQHTLPMNDALKLMLSPYAKSAPLRSDAVDELTSRILSTASTITDEADDPLGYSTIQTGGIDDAILGDEPSQTPTQDTETLPDFNSQTKVGRFPPRDNSLLANDDQNKKLVNRNQPSYHGEAIELFCTTGFDCGNGVCLSSEKICDGRNDCGNRMDEKTCKHISYDVRLSGEGGRQNVGRIEVKIFDKWSYICGVGFGINEANVFCREAGFPLGALEVKLNHNYQSQVAVDDSPSYVVDELRCGGNETSLKDCAFNGWDLRDCNSEETVGVVCKLPDMKCPLNYWLCDQSEECVPTAFLCDAVKDCSDGSDESDSHCNSSIQYRLGNHKSNHKEGRVEVRYKGIWGTVCDDDFGENEAKVFCRSLGYDGAAAVIKEFAEPGDGLIWLDQVSCVGNETSLETCTHFEWGENNCNHTEDVSVRCFEREFDTHQKLTMRDQRSGFSHLNEIHHENRPEQDDHCGQIRVTNEPDNYDDQPVFKVIEGREAKRGHHPWQATLRVRGRNGKSSHWCGAVLISGVHALTAAHCLIGFTKNAYFIRLGDHHSETPEDTEVEVFIEDWHIHEKFRKGHLMNNDIALIKLKSAVKFTDYIQPICLPTAETDYTPGKNCSISGWGSTQYGKSTPSLQLRSASIPIISQDICKESLNHGSSIQSGMFCAGILGNVIDACDGDSGGPFVCQEDEENGYHSLYGIISWGQRCGDKNKPGVYTKVSEYLPWIEEKMLL